MAGVQLLAAPRRLYRLSLVALFMLALLAVAQYVLLVDEIERNQVFAQWMSDWANERNRVRQCLYQLHGQMLTSTPAAPLPGACVQLEPMPALPNPPPILLSTHAAFSAALKLQAAPAVTGSDQRQQLWLAGAEYLDRVNELTDDYRQAHYQPLRQLQLWLAGALGLMLAVLLLAWVGFLRPTLGRLSASLTAFNAELAERQRVEQRLEQNIQEMVRSRRATLNLLVDLHTEISERRAIEIQLRQQAQELVETNRYKTEFFSNMSHELRTPLNSILLLSAQLKGNRWGNLNEKQLEFAGVIELCGNDLRSLIDDILDLSQLELNKMPLEAESFTLPGLVARLQLIFAPVAQAKQLSFIVELAADCPAILCSDERRIEQVIKNLLANAFKFTTQGRVQLLLRGAGPDCPLARLDSVEPIVEVVVQDSGIGIAADQLEAIFEAFRQVDGSVRRRFGGTGLGLTISKHLVKRLQGALTVTSQPQVGSRFCLWLPSLTPASAAGQPSHLDQPQTEQPGQQAQGHDRQGAQG